ncbi:MAG TPA: SPOR domain-containing protein [Methyloceanibacter sp.]|nr:SPOR domain-containing protein [Methyloceanibacter sp.]
MIKDRRSGRSGSRNWTRGVFAFFWIVLAGFSGLYLLSVFVDPSALGGQLVRFNPLPGGAPSSGNDAFGSDQISGHLTNEGSDPELAEIKAALRQLSQQMAELNTRLKPIEKVVGPVASLPSTPSVTPSPSTPEPAAPSVAPSSPIKKPEATSAPVSPPPATAPAEQAKATEKPTPPSVKPAEKPPEVKAAEKPAEPPVETPKPTQQAALEPKPTPPSSPKPAEPPSVATAPMDDVPEDDSTGDTSAPEPAASAEAPSPSSSGTNDSAKPASPTESAKPAGSTESASLDPVALPPAANDGSTRYGIEIGVVAKQDGLRPLWREFLTNHSALVAGLQPRRVLAPDKKWRLIAGPFANAAEATQACALFKKASRPCEATVYAGDSL